MSRGQKTRNMQWEFHVRRLRRARHPCAHSPLTDGGRVPAQDDKC